MSDRTNNTVAQQIAIDVLRWTTGYMTGSMSNLINNTGVRRRKPPRHGLGGPRHYSSWAVEHVLDRIELSPADGVWKIVDDRFLPVRFGNRLAC